MNKVDSFDELEVYHATFALQQDLFTLSRHWPKVEDYSLTDQIRRSSRSIGANIAESWAKRRYPAHFLSKLTDADGELQETLHWLKTAQACAYVIGADHERLFQQTQKIGRLLGGMINRYEAFCY
jgi:four helix bundle protein